MIRCLLLFGLLSGMLPAMAEAQQTADPTPVLQAGDAVRITVWNREELTGEFPVAADGTITHPVFRSVVVAGLPLAAIEQRVGEAVGRFESNPQFVIEPLLRVSVGGEVRQPSLYRLPPTTSIAEAVALAGGASERGRLDKVRLFRGGEELRIDMTSPEAGLAQDAIRSGDQIYVDRRTSLFRDYVAPAGSITAAIVSLIAVLTR